MEKAKRKRLCIFFTALLMTALLPTAAFAREYSGHVDAVSGGGVSGWAWDGDKPDSAVEVEILISQGNGPGTTTAYRVTANKERKDLAGTLGSAAHAFSLPVDWERFTASRLTVTAAVIDGESQSRVPLEEAYIYDKGGKVSSLTKLTGAALSSMYAGINESDVRVSAGPGEEMHNEPEDSASQKGRETVDSGGPQGGPASDSGRPQDELTSEDDKPQGEPISDSDKTQGGPESGSGRPQDELTSEDGKSQDEPASEDDDPQNGQESENGRQGAYLGEYTVTGYCSCTICTSGSGITYAGTVPRPNHTAGANLSQHPLGSKVMIDGIIYTIEDTGSGSMTNYIDIYFATHEEAVAYGTQKKDVYAVEPE